MTLLIQNIPQSLEAALQKKARDEGKSVDQVVIETLEAGVQTAKAPIHHDLDWIAGTWVEDPDFDRIMKEQDQVNPDDWK
ncbi:MAG TPA: hypothetical protein VG269_29650 [Tepidisphaeraceae bacterium]|jgi:plasmid stability protein|nr:hypothetical protein [Tepidisphaeraceae bacterium]